MSENESEISNLKSEISDSKSQISDDVADDAAPQNASERWVKYGLNVVLTSLLVLVLAFLVVWAAQRWRTRGDLTVSGSYSLKPQTVSVIGDIKAPVKLVSLYPRLKQEPGQGRSASQSGATDQDFYQPVDDILQEYKRKGKNIDVDTIDPAAEPAKLDLWLGEVTRKYGGNVKAYRDLLQGFPATLAEIKKLADAEVEKMKKLRGVEVNDERQAETINAAYNTVLAFPALIGTLTGGIEEELKEKIPDYKGRTQAVEGSMNLFSRQVEAVRKALDTLQNEQAAPQPIRDYAKGSLASFDAMKKQADDVLGKIKGLGELKLDEVRRRLVAPDGEQPAPAIAVMGENDIKLIDFKDVWKSGESTGLAARSGTGAPRLRFAGEQQLTSAILSLSQPQKTKVAFVRAGGPPKAGGAGPFGGGGGECSEIADRLRAYNFEVLEKDLSGQAMQRAMMGGMPPPNEATDEQIKDAIWVVFAEPQMTQFGPMPGGPELANKVKEHLDRGGSALCLFYLQGDDLSAALKDWGLEVKTNVVAVHEAVRTDAEPGDDFVEYARRQPPIFVINQYGGDGHPITSTLQSLDAALVPMLPVLNKGAEGAKVTSMLPVPTNIPAWGEGDTAFLFNRRSPAPKYDPDSGDQAPPLFCGAAVEKNGKGRLVAIGCTQFIENGMLAINDPKLSRNNLQVARFPGNGELFTNSIFWLAKMEKMIALSPSAMDTPRIRQIPDTVLAFWRIGVLLVGLPATALLSGFLVWRTRRD